MNRTLGFEKIIVLNLPQRHDKRDEMSLSASVSRIDFEWMDGVDGASMSAKSKPSMMNDELSGDNNTLGCWRAHMNALQHVVKENIETALIMEDDADWDVNLKQQLVDFARGSKYLQGNSDSETSSPYGDDWDMLWLGHCGVYHGPRSSQRFWTSRDDPTVVPPELHRWQRRRPDMRHPLLSSNFSRITFAAKGGLCAIAYAIALLPAFAEITMS
ncbi:hypothetical protein BST61_g9763 [Cercospora zeina]